MIVSLQTMHHMQKQKKHVELSKAPNGIIGFETALPAEIMNLVDPGHIDYLNLVRLTSYTPSKLLHIENERGSYRSRKNGRYHDI